MNELKLRNLYRLSQSFKTLDNVDGSFFSFKIACSNNIVYKPQISLYLPYLGEIVQQKFVFNKGWRQLETLFYHSIQGKLNPTLQTLQIKGIDVLDVYTPVGEISKQFYKNVVDIFELYKITEILTSANNFISPIDSISDFCTITQYNMSVFNPDKKLYFTHKEGDLFSGSAYHLDGFNEPDHLGSFYHTSKEDVEKNIKSLFL